MLKFFKKSETALNGIQVLTVKDIETIKENARLEGYCKAVDTLRSNDAKKAELLHGPGITQRQWARWLEEKGKELFR